MMIYIKFYLRKMLSSFSLGLKKLGRTKLSVLQLKIKKIAKKHKVKFIINDDPAVSKVVNADGCHLGQNDMMVINAKKISEKKRL